MSRQLTDQELEEFLTPGIEEASHQNGHSQVSNEETSQGSTYKGVPIAGKASEEYGFVRALLAWKNPATKVKVILCSDLQLMRSTVLSVLEQNNIPPSIFVMGSTLVRVSCSEHGKASIIPITEDMLRNRIDQCVEFGSYKVVATPNDKEERDAHKDVWIKRKVPMDIVRSVMAETMWNFPPLRGIMNTPIIRDDGSVVAETGYDAYTGLYYVASRSLEDLRVPMSPSRQEAIDAIQYLYDAMSDFPFVSQSDRTNALAALFTPLVHSAYEGFTPIRIIDAPSAGTGKGLLEDYISVVATGEEANTQPQPENDTEMRKLLTSIQISGVHTFTFDNIEGKFDSPALASFITSRHRQDRLLSTNRMIASEPWAIVAINGNNVQLGKDIPRRCYRIRMDAQVARPWERTSFKHPDLLKWAKEQRRELVEKILTVVRAWGYAGKPYAKSIVTLGSFQAWSTLMSNIFAYVNVDGFLVNRYELYEQIDADRQQNGVFFYQWHQTFGDRFITVKEVGKYVADNRDSDFVDALPTNLATELANKGIESFKRYLGNFLKYQVDLRYELPVQDGQVYPDIVHLVRSSNVSHHAFTWKVVVESVKDTKKGSQGSQGESNFNPIGFSIEEQNNFLAQSQMTPLDSPDSPFTNEQEPSQEEQYEPVPLPHTLVQYPYDVYTWFREAGLKMPRDTCTHSHRSNRYLPWLNREGQWREVCEDCYGRWLQATKGASCYEP